MKNLVLFSARLSSFVVMAVLLSACSSGNLMSDVSRAIYNGKFGQGSDVTTTSALNPALQYLRGQVVGYPAALLVLGYVEPHPSGEVEFWYSADKEMIKIQNGRIVGTAGLQTDWRNVRFADAPPTWVAAKAAPQSLVRKRDQTPEYRYGITDQLLVEHVNDKSVFDFPNTLTASFVNRHDWYRETTSNPLQSSLPASWYAVGQHDGRDAVVFSFQCLAPKLCLSLQRWPPEKE